MTLVPDSSRTGPPTGTAGGDLTGSYPSPTLAAIGSAAGPIGGSSAVPVVTIDTKGRVTALTSAAISSAPSGAAGGDLAGNYPNPSLAAVGSAAGPLGSATVTPIVTTDANGRVTALSSTTIAGVAPGGAAGGDLAGTYPSPTIGTGKIVGSYIESIGRPALRQGIGLDGRGFLAENFVPSMITANNAYVSQHAVYFGNLGILSGDSVAGIVLCVNTAAAGNAPTGAFVGLYKAAGTQLAVSNNLNAASNWPLGYTKLPFSSAYVASADQAVYAAFLINGAFGTTQPSFLGGANGIKSMGTKLTGKMACIQGATGLTTLPSPTATFNDTADFMFWCALYT